MWLGDCTLATAFDIGPLRQQLESDILFLMAGQRKRAGSKGVAKPCFDLKVFLSKANWGKTSGLYAINEPVFVQVRSRRRHLLRQGRQG